MRSIQHDPVRQLFSVHLHKHDWRASRLIASPSSLPHDSLQIMQVERQSFQCLHMCSEYKYSPCAHHRSVRPCALISLITALIMSAISSALSATSAIPIPYTSTVQTTLVDEGFLSIVDHTLIVTKATVYGTLAGTYTVTDSQGVTTTSVAASATSTGWGPFVPLTTTFTPPPDCFKNWHAYSWNITNARSAYPTFYLPNGDRGDCFPKDFMLLEYIDPYYSPGICPSGYWLASTGVTTSTRSAGVVTIKKGDCCPS
jgi:hypothetical protein